MWSDVLYICRAIYAVLYLQYYIRSAISAVLYCSAISAVLYLQCYICSGISAVLATATGTPQKASSRLSHNASRRLARLANFNVPFMGGFVWKLKDDKVHAPPCNVQ